MGYFAKILLVVLIFGSLQTSAFGQRRGRVQGSKGTAPRQQAVNLPFPTARQYVHQSPVVGRYDRFNDRTSVSVETGLNAVLRLRASFSYGGDKLHSPPNSVVFIFTQISSYRLGISGGDFIRNREVIILSDGQPVRKRGVYNDGGVTENGWHEEDLAIEIPVRAFLSIVNSQSVSAKVSGFEIDFTRENFEALRDLASRMNPNAKVEPTEQDSPSLTQSSLEAKAREAEAISSQLESLAARSNQPTANQVKQPTEPPRKVSPLVGSWLLRLSNANGQSNSLGFQIEQEGEAEKCYVVDGGVKMQLTNCTVSPDGFSFLLKNVPIEGQRFDITFSGRLTGGSISGNAVANSPTGISVTLPMTGTRIE
jgi:hypothetical protein